MHLLVATWNVNSVRSRLAHLTRWIGSAGPDILMLQETKVRDEDFPAAALEGLGYHVTIHGQKTYNGVATLTRTAPTSVRTGLGSGFLSDQSRVLLVEAGGVRFLNVYVPNGGDPSIDRFRDKLRFMEELAEDAAGLAGEGPLVIGGDFNTAPTGEDVHDPVALEGSIGFHPEERSRFAGLMARGLVDAFRLVNPSGRAYSWWDYRQGGFRTDRGMRLDHILVSRSLAGFVTASSIDREPRGWEKPSDHAPVVVVLDLPPAE